MQGYKYVLLAIAALQFAATAAYSQTLLPLAPLAVGNVWVYQEHDTSAALLRYYISDTTNIDGKTYFICSKGYSDSALYHFRLREDSIYVRFLGGGETPYYKRFAAENDSFFHSVWFGRWKFRITSVTSETVFGRDVLVKEMFADIILLKNNERWTDEFGLLSGKTLTGSRYFILKGCVIDNVLYGDTAMTTTDVKENSPAADAWRIEQNYPNPFNSSTNIVYHVPEGGGYIELTVHDLLGRQVAVIANGYRTAGKYTAGFDASALSSGVYFYTLNSAGSHRSKKLLLMK